MVKRTWVKNMKLVQNAKEVWLHYSTQALIVVASAQGVWVLMPQAWIDTYPKWVTPTVASITGVVAALVVLGKFIKQDLPSDK